MFTMQSPEDPKFPMFIQPNQLNSSANFAFRFQRRLSRLVMLSWLLATGEDMRYPLVVGKQPTPLDRLAHRFLDFLFIASNRDEMVGTTLLQVVQMIKSPLHLANPILLTRALIAVLFGTYRHAKQL